MNLGRLHKSDLHVRSITCTTHKTAPSTNYHTMTFSTPTKRIASKHDLECWIDSPTYNAVVGFIENLQNSVVGLTNQAPVAQLAAITEILRILDRVGECIDQHPVEKEKDVLRFGKTEFRDFYDEVALGVSEIIGDIVPKEAISEVSVYFIDSWGDRTRIDYGSGHELNFICFLYCLEKLGKVSQSDHQALVLKVFTKYISVMRRLQKNYWLEPAGLHGVWGLDDYHFLPFLFGAAQLATHPHMRPKSIHNKELVDQFWLQYMYFECIHFINLIKAVPGQTNAQVSLRWHSPMLDDILSAKLWQKIKDGMIKMYKAEVLAKLPIVQHFFFGSLLPCPEGVELHFHEKDLLNCGHIHLDELNTWGDCCGIKIPSAIAASEMNKRLVPFD